MADLVIDPSFGASAGPPFRSFVGLVRSPRHATVRRAALAVAVVAVAFHYSLTTLVRSLKDETPLAYLGLVPFIALVLGASAMRPERDDPPIHDRQLDYLLGIPMLLAALTFVVVQPIRMSTLFWLCRLDLLALPLFAAGTITLIFGVRTLWRLRLAVLFLLLAWPLPYTTLLTNWLTAFTGSTLHGLNLMLDVAHVAAKDPSQGSGFYTVSHGAKSFPVSVASACSGVNGIVGYLLVAVAFLSVVTGTWIGKIAWLALGLVAVWMSNVVRIFAILAVGHRWGETLAIDVLHPVAGLVMFNLVIGVLVLVMGRFGLRVTGTPTISREEVGPYVTRAVPKLRVATSILIASAAFGYVANSSLRSFDLVVSSLGAPRLTAFTGSPSHPSGWSVRQTNQYTWARPFFGNDSTWYRYAFDWTGSPSAVLQTNQTVIADVINTSDVTTFSTYGIEACYRFHGYKLHSIRTVDLGGGVTGNVLVYYNGSTRSDWTTVYWHWPVKTASGKTRYERVTLMMTNTANAQFKGGAPTVGALRQLGLNVQNALGGQGTNSNSGFDATRVFLVDFARAVIVAQAANPAAPAAAAATSR